MRCRQALEKTPKDVPLHLDLADALNCHWGRNGEVGQNPTVFACHEEFFHFFRVFRGFISFSGVL